MSNHESSKEFHDKLLAGSDTAAMEFDSDYRKRLCELVRREMDHRLCGKEDPEDVVQSAFRTFFRRAKEGEFQIDCSSALWRLLEKITRRKILKHVERLRATKRNPDRERPTQAGQPVDIASSNPTAEEAAAFVDTIETILAGLESPYPEILSLRLEGCTIAEVAKQTGCTPGVVRYKLERLQDRLGKLIGQDIEP